MTDINEDTELTIPVKNLLGMLAFTAVATMAYFTIEARLTSLEYKSQLMEVEIEENDEWIDEFKPPKAVQDTIERVRLIELKLKEMEVRMEGINNGS